MKEDTRPRRSYMESVFSCLCPRCREGKLFQHKLSFRFRSNMKMYDACPVCGQPTDIEVGFYYGTGYVSYLIGLVITAFTCITWALIIGFSFNDRRFLYWLIFNSVFLIAIQPWMMRFSRALWLSWFIKYDPEWEIHKPAEPERFNKDQMGNW